MKNTFSYIFSSILFLLMTISCSENNNIPDDIIDEETTIKRYSDEEILDMVQENTFRYFWDYAHPVSGMIPRDKDGDLVVMGGSGFEVLAIITGIQRGYITRTQGAERLLKMVIFLNEKADRFHGAWSHWLSGSTGEVKRFSEKDDGGDIVETAFMIQGLLTAKQYFNADDNIEKTIRETITKLWEEVEWDWYTNGNPHILWHWSPNYDFEKNLVVRGFNEAMIVYILAVASPTHSVDASLFDSGWAGNNYVSRLDPATRSDQGGTLFMTHYSHLCLPATISDKYIKQTPYKNYFERHKKQTLLNRDWCIRQKGMYSYYNENCWGLTASKDPDGYKAHKPNLNSDNGTITPTAGVSAIIYTPQESIALIHYLIEDLSDKYLFGKYGFVDAFNFDRKWLAPDFLALDQGPIIVMIENYRTGLLWDNFMKNQEILTSLDKIGFEITE